MKVYIIMDNDKLVEFAILSNAKFEELNYVNKRIVFSNIYPITKDFKIKRSYCDLCKIKGFLIPNELIADVLVDDVEVIIGMTSYKIPFDFLNKIGNNKHINDEYYIEFNHDYFFEIPLYICLCDPMYSTIKIRVKQENIKIILEGVLLDLDERHRIMTSKLIKTRIRQVHKIYNNIPVKYRNITSGLFISSSLKNIESIKFTLNADDYKFDKLNYDNVLLNIYSQKIDKNFYYISFNTNTDYKSYNMDSSIDLSKLNLLLSIKYLDDTINYEPSYIVTYNILYYRNAYINILHYS
jgi:hypothetical protein